VARLEAVELVVAGAAPVADAEEPRREDGRGGDLDQGDVEAEGLVAGVGEVADGSVDLAPEATASGRRQAGATGLDQQRGQRAA
jgi:hypothetical protein